MRYNLHLDKIDWVEGCHTIDHGGVEYKCKKVRSDGGWVVCVQVGDVEYTSKPSFWFSSAMGDALTQAGLNFAIR